MNTDDVRFHQYLNARASTLELPEGDPSRILDRAVHRRRRRRSAGTTVLALALVAGAITVQQTGDDGRELSSEALAPTAADPLQWTAVTPNAALGESASTVVADDGTLFGLSTAPGSRGMDAYEAPKTLYRSSDGVEWSAVALPDDLFPSSLATTAGQLYAVGTAPASAGSKRMVLTSGDAAGTWRQADLPVDFAALEAAYGDAVRLADLDVAASGGDVLATVLIQAHPDAHALVPEGAAVDAEWGFEWTATGVDFIDYGKPELERERAAGLASTVVPEAPATELPLGPPTVAASFTWAQLGVDERLQNLIAGELSAFVSTDGGTTFAPVSLPAGARDAYALELVGTDDGFVLLGSRSDRDVADVTAAWRSADGRTWTADSVTLPGWLSSVGTIGGQAAAITTRDSAVLHVARADGSWSSLDLGEAFEAPAGADVYPAASGVGPLGAATVFSAGHDSEGRPAELYLVHSPDGVSTSVVRVGDLLGDDTFPSSVRVSADAVLASFTVPGGAELPRSTRLLVGTPR
jgi:hypothetical protein